MAKRELTEAQKQELRDRLARGREAKAAKAAAEAERPKDEPEPADQEPEDEPLPEAAAGDPPALGDPLVLSDAELDRIRAEAKKKIAKELEAANDEARKALIAKELDAETRRQRAAAGLADHNDDLIEILIDCPPFADRLVVDGVAYHHGQWRTVERRVYNSLREMMARGWDAEDRAGNPNKQFHRHSAGSMNPWQNERQLSDGTYTVRGEGIAISRDGGVMGNAPRMN